MSDERLPDENRDRPKQGLFKRLFSRAEPQPEPVRDDAVAEEPDITGLSEPPGQEDAVPPLLPEMPTHAAAPIIAGEEILSANLAPHLEPAPPQPSLLKRFFGFSEPVAEVPVQPAEGPAEFHEKPAAEPPAPEAAAPSRSWWTRLREGLSRSSGSIGTGLVEIFTKRKLDDAMLEELEDILIRSDLGLAAATRITKAVGKGRFDKTIDVEDVKSILAEEVEQVLAPYALPLVIGEAQKPFVILIVGVNGSGKTTTIGKLASKFRQEGKSVMLAAGDTFRAAAIAQLRIWGERLGCPVIARDQGSDAAGLAFDAIQAARTQQSDVLLMDTAGRLQNRAELMAELEKIIRVMKKVDASAPHAVLLVLDATVGQNALSQVEIFGRVAGVTGLVMTKLDGTARGGILVAVTEKFHLPVHFIGVGETAEDLESFEARDFARAIAGIED